MNTFILIIIALILLIIFSKLWIKLINAIFNPLIRLLEAKPEKQKENQTTDKKKNNRKIGYKIIQNNNESPQMAQASACAHHTASTNNQPHKNHVNHK